MQSTECDDLNNFLINTAKRMRRERSGIALALYEDMNERN